MRTDPHFIKQILLAVTLAVLAAGFAREAFVLEIGTHTVLQDLRQFHLDSENSVPAWWSSSLMLVAAMVLYRLGAEAKAAGDRMWQLWALLAVAFFFLSMDEAASFHEGVIEPLKSAFGFGGIFFYAWVVPAVLCLGGFGLLIPAAAAAAAAAPERTACAERHHFRGRCAGDGNGRRVA